MDLLDPVAIRMGRIREKYEEFQWKTIPKAIPALLAPDIVGMIDMLADFESQHPRSRERHLQEESSSWDAGNRSAKGDKAAGKGGCAIGWTSLLASQRNSGIQRQHDFPDKPNWGFQD